jgi:hypothetical protein
MENDSQEANSRKDGLVSHVAVHLPAEASNRKSLTREPPYPILPFPRGEFRIISFCPKREREKGQGWSITGPGQKRERFCSGKEVFPFFLN